MKNDDDDRFGVDPGLIASTFERHLKVGVIRVGCYVPTRQEVTTKPIAWLEPVLADWFWESPEELAPDDEQVASVVQILLGRADADDARIRTIIADAPFRSGGS